MRPILSVFMPICIGLLLSSCAGMNNTPKTEITLPLSYSGKDGNSSGKVQIEAWWQNFRDPALNNLVEAGLSDNLDIRRALESVEAANANITVAKAGGRPTLDAAAAATVSRADAAADTLRTATAVGSFGWALDLFGRYRAAARAAEATRDAAIADTDVTRLAILLDISTSYVDAAYYRARTRNISASLSSLRTTLALTQQLRDAGEASDLDMVQVRSRIASTQINLPDAKAAEVQSVNHISTLLNIPAGTTFKNLARATQPLPSGKVGTGVPAELLRNRPDIRREELQLIAAGETVGVAKANLYPSLSLNGTVTASRLISAAATGGAVGWSFGPTLDIPIFDGGQRRANLAIARSDVKNQYLLWRQTVLEAVEDVEAALADLEAARRKLSSARSAVSTASRRLSMARESYSSGTLTLLDVLDSERDLSDVRLSLVDASREVANAYIRLNISLGWQPEQPDEPEPRQVAKTQSSRGGAVPPRKQAAAEDMELRSTSLATGAVASSSMDPAQGANEELRLGSR